MEETPDGTPVGVDDPYEYAGPCDHLTGDGRCRYALDYAGQDPEFAADRRADDYECLVGAEQCSAGWSSGRCPRDAADDADWSDCPHYRSTTDGKSCARCGLAEVRMAHDAARPLVEEHHLSYGTGRSPGNRGGAAEEGGPGRGGRRSDGRPRPGSERDDVSRVRETGNEGVASGSDDRDAKSDRDADGDDAPSHEITISLCRWCHAKVHKGFARVDDDANPDPEAIAERESRRGTEMGEFGFSTARERRRNE